MVSAIAKSGVATIVLLSGYCLASCSPWRETHFLLPGEVVVSQEDSILYSDGLHAKTVRISRSAGTAQVSGALVGADGKTYGILSSDDTATSGGSIVQVNTDGSSKSLISLPRILDLGATSTELIALVQNGSGCPTLDWITYEGRISKQMTAPCQAYHLSATADGKLLLSGGSDADPQIYNLAGNNFEPVGQGYRAAWIDSNEFIYNMRDHERMCVFEQAVARSERRLLLCGDSFEAVSPDGRYLALAELNTRYMQDVNEILVLDSVTNRRSTICYCRGQVSWARPEWITALPPEVP